MRNRIKYWGVFLAMMILVQTIVAPVSVFAANGPSSVKTDNAYIIVGKTADSKTTIYSYDGTAQTLEGVSYDKDSNTLTVENFTGEYIEANTMGDDFSLKVVGTNNVGYINVLGYGYGGSLKITGDGILNITGSSKDATLTGLIIMAEDSASSLVFDSKVTVNFKTTDQAYAICVIDSTVAKPIRFESGLGITNGKVENVPYKITIPIEDEYGSRSLWIAKKDGTEYLVDPWTYTDGTAGIELLELSADRAQYTVNPAVVLEWDGNSEKVAGLLQKAGYSLVEGPRFVVDATGFSVAPIKVAKAKISKVTAASKAITVKLGKVSGAAGYQIRYSTAKSMKGAKTVLTTSTSKKITKLKAKKTYYVQVRAYKLDANGNKVYGSWSSVKSAKTK